MLNEIEDPVGARSLYMTHDFSVAGELMGYIKRNFLGNGTEKGTSIQNNSELFCMLAP